MIISVNTFILPVDFKGSLKFWPFPDILSTQQKQARNTDETGNHPLTETCFKQERYTSVSLITQTTFLTKSCLFRVHSSGFLSAAFKICIHNCREVLWSDCSSLTIEGSLLAPLMNSSRDSLPINLTKATTKMLFHPFIRVTSEWCKYWNTQELQ